MLLKELDQPESLLSRVTDRLGHDRRYAVDCSLIRRELGWAPEISLAEGLRATVDWYNANREWTAHARSGEYRSYYDRQYGKDLGAAGVN